MINLEDALNIYEFLINKFGGSHGVRDLNLLKSALARPFQTFDKKDLYKTPSEKAAAIIESLVTNHPFIDGNKRIGWVLMRLYLMEVGLDIKASQESRYEFVISIASNKLPFQEIVDWIDRYVLQI